MQASFRLSDVVIRRLLHFFIAVFSIIGRTCTTARDVAKCLPQSLSRCWVQLNFSGYVVCKKWFSIYTFDDCVQKCGSVSRSKKCSFQRFPSHPHASMRAPCGTLLLKSVELATKKSFLYPFMTYCYLGLNVSSQSLFNRPTFYERWRSRRVNQGEMHDVYDGRMWHKFLSYDGNPFFLSPAT